MHHLVRHWVVLSSLADSVATVHFVWRYAYLQANDLINLLKVNPVMFSRYWWIGTVFTKSTDVSWGVPCRTVELAMFFGNLSRPLWTDFLTTWNKSSLCYIKITIIYAQGNLICIIWLNCILVILTTFHQLSTVWKGTPLSAMLEIPRFQCFIC